MDVDLAKAKSGVRLRFGKAHNSAAFFPLAAFFEQLDPFETLQDIAFRDDGAGSSEGERGKFQMRSCGWFRSDLATADYSERRIDQLPSSGDKYGNESLTAAANTGHALV